MGEYNEINDFKEVLFTKDQIDVMTKSMGEKITEDFKEKDLVVIGLLKGSVVFLADLVREIKLSCELDFMAVSSYGNGTESLGRVQIIKDISESVLGKDVLVVEDIVDSGITLNFIVSHLKNKGAKSVTLCTLINKPERRKKPVDVKYIGADIPNEFIAGYGMDYAEKYRNLPFIGVLKEEVYSK
ncbi:MAG: hypoxanthine phosphoribosyltransferase [Acutalibacteraceae bacterium]|nr:hypoxanthine phosphoribosyltransferase [Acutalibacteraceae bacterium]